MKSFIFAYRETATGELKEVKTVAADEKKAIKAFKLKVPGVDVNKIEQINSSPISNAGGSVQPIVGPSISDTGPQKNRVTNQEGPKGLQESGEKPQSYVLGIVGIICLVIGLYLLLLNPGSETDIGDIVNLQKLSIGQTFSIVGAIFVAVQWRPR